MTAKRRTDRLAWLGRAIEIASDGIVALDATGTITGWSEGALRIFGYRSEEALGLPMTAFVVEEDRHSAVEAQRRVVEDSASIPELEVGARRRDGRSIAVSMALSPVSDAAGVGAILAVVRDITDRARATEELRILSELVTDVAYVGHVEGDRVKLEWVSEALTRMTGLTQEEFEARGGWRGIAHPDDQALVAEHVARLRSGGDDLVEVRVMLTPDDMRWMRIHTRSVVEESTGRVRVYGAAEDVTDQRRAEEGIKKAYEREHAAAAELREANRLKDEFVSVVSHELRAPVTAVLGFAAVLVERWGEVCEEDRVNFLERIRHNAEGMAQMIERLLEFSRVDSGGVRVRLVPVRLLDAVRSTMDIVGSSLDKRRVDVRVDGDLVVRGDANGIAHVLGNLLTNAGKYSKDGSTIRLVATPAEDHVLVQVEDEGVGISPETLAHLFERFYQGHEQPTGRRGAGVGLAIARSYVELMGGRIWAESQPGRGSRFSFTLPLA